MITKALLLVWGIAMLELLLTAVLVANVNHAGPTESEIEPLDKAPRIVITLPSLVQSVDREIELMSSQLARTIQLDNQAARVSPWVYNSGVVQIVDDFESALDQLQESRRALRSIVITCQNVDAMVNHRSELLNISAELDDVELTLELLIAIAKNEN